MARQAAAAYRVTQREIKETMRAHQANANDLNASVTVRSPKFPLFRFGVTDRKTPLVVVEEVVAKRTQLSRGFMAIMKSGHVGIFERVGKSRLPIREMSALASAQMIGAKRSWPVIEPQLESYFLKQLQVNLRYFLEIAPNRKS
jgi:hypothetical protein